MQQRCSEQHLCCVCVCNLYVEVDECRPDISASAYQFIYRKQELIIVFSADQVNTEVTSAPHLPPFYCPIGRRQSADWIPVGQLWRYRGADQ